MNAELKAAVETLKASYGDIDREAATYGNLNPLDIQKALQAAQVDTADFVVLALLANHFPAGKVKQMVVNDVVLPTSVINESVPVADSTAE
jgi:hypothetical protein